MKNHSSPAGQQATTHHAQACPTCNGTGSVPGYRQNVIVAGGEPVDLDGEGFRVPDGVTIDPCTGELISGPSGGEKGPSAAR